MAKEPHEKVDIHAYRHAVTAMRLGVAVVYSYVPKRGDPRTKQWPVVLDIGGAEVVVTALTLRKLERWHKHNVLGQPMLFWSGR